MPPTGIRYVFVMSRVLLSCCVEVMDSGVASVHAHPHSHAHARKMNGKDGPRRRTGAGGVPPRSGRPVDHDPLRRSAGGPFPFVIAAPAARRRRGASAREVASGVVRGRTVRPARAPGRFPVVMLTRIKAADSNRGAFRPLPASGFSVRVGRRRESNPRPVIPSHMLCPTELLRWRSEPRGPNDTRRAMVSFGAPDRYPEPEPLFGPRSHCLVDGPRCGGRRGSFGASGTRRFRPGDSERGQRDAKPRVGYGVVRGTGGERSRPLRWRRAVEVVRAAKERSGCAGIRGRGNKKAPVGLHAGRGFRFRETCGGAFLRGSPDRCPGDLHHELTVHGP